MISMFLANKDEKTKKENIVFERIDVPIPKGYSYEIEDDFEPGYSQVDPATIFKNNEEMATEKPLSLPDATQLEILDFRVEHDKEYHEELKKKYPINDGFGY